jgi:hypothetical protein
MRPFASHPVSPTVTVSAPGSGYEHSAAVHAGVTGHPAAGSKARIQATKRQGATSYRNDHGRLRSVPVPSKGARHRNRPGRRIRQDASGRYHCSSGPCWPDRALSASRMVRVLGLSWGFAGGRCWVRTNVGLADSFTDRPFLPIGIATDLLFPHFLPREYRVLSVWRP